MGDKLMVKEVWGYAKEAAQGEIPMVVFKDVLLDGADKWRSPVTMPAWASRYTLTVKSVNIERINDIWMWVIEHEGVS